MVLREPATKPAGRSRHRRTRRPGAVWLVVCGSGRLALHSTLSSANGFETCFAYPERVFARISRWIAYPLCWLLLMIVPMVVDAFRADAGPVSRTNQFTISHLKGHIF